jgi:hypothetical protein
MEEGTAEGAEAGVAPAGAGSASVSAIAGTAGNEPASDRDSVALKEILGVQGTDERQQAAAVQLQ